MMKHQNLTQFLGHKLILWTAILLTLTMTNFRIGLVSVVAQEALTTAMSQEIVALKASQKRWIEIDLSTQRLIAWEGDRPVHAVIVSTGKKETPTRPGVFSIQSKRPLDRMRGADYDVPDVPYAMYYHRGYAIHGAYWHNSFGTPVSHGCINLAVDHAKWLFQWASLKTPVIIHE
jgi:lipoprotein-anchoring transpeptidase ErfK/SrfK